MIEAVEIKNFKSADKLDLDFGRVNVFIGENGAGKSTILEAITFVGAAEADRLDDEFLELRGIRTVSPQLMRSAFNRDSCNQSIEINIQSNVNDRPTQKRFVLSHDNDLFSEWEVDRAHLARLGDDDKKLDMDFHFFLAEVLSDLAEKQNLSGQEIYTMFQSVGRERGMDTQEIESRFGLLNSDDGLERLQTIAGARDEYENRVDEAFGFLKKFAIYSPQIEQLKELNRESKMKPLGIYGEGLFLVLRKILTEQPEAFSDIEKGLDYIGWFRGFSMKDESGTTHDLLSFKDRYIKGLELELRNTNEGFLYMLFYMVLFVSKDTPKIFAIDNIDSALNPKLCQHMIEYLSKLAKKYDKQVFFTTHNPAILDGIDLNDDEQRIFVVSRNKRSGATKAKRLTLKDKPKDSNGEPIRLSEAMLRGYIPNALPKGF
ncbi:AAA family ATPase [Vibrio coralliilyticus]|uniref:AAA family ATPase n=1 Tax=Vibrio coralliilyticus TaxID=190893 RepID=UPI000512866A|nr:AAA family ATPase [Vibrio coralliilyticus]AIU67011.1 hypothetical protein JV59_32345 [Vibrio coralliilyticus]